jgi:DNA-binding HxlR family transcriptional regulator
MAGSGKEKKKEVRDDVTSVLRRLTEELTSLRSEVNAIREGQLSLPAEKVTTATDGNARIHPASLEEARSDLESLDDNAIARVAYAFSSAPKVSLVRHLLLSEELSAAELGERAGLTTGSLYHHLRELIHSGVVTQANRNRYSLSEMGKRLALSIFSLATA